MSKDWYQKILDQFHKERNTQAFYKTKGFAKLWRYLRATIEKEKNQETMVRLRRKYNIPVNGFSLEGKKSWTHPPETWRHYTNKFAVMGQIRSELRDFTKELGLLPRDWTDIIEEYLFYNKLFLSLQPNARNLCFVTDANTRADSLGHILDETDAQLYPTTLHISPHASKRDILDYIEKIFKTEIAPLQEKYKRKDVKIGGYKKRSERIRARDTFIYKNRHLPRKKIVSLVMEQFRDVEAPIDAGSVGKVISIEKKRRKEV